MDKFRAVAGACFFLLGLLLGWVLGFHSERAKKPVAADEFDKGAGI